MLTINNMKSVFNIKRNTLESAFNIFCSVVRGLSYNGKAPLPLLIIWEITLKCNLRCKMCGLYGKYGSFPDTKNELTTEEIKKGIDSIAEDYKLMPYKPFIGFTGGEPFVRNDMFEIIRYLKSKGFKYAITTNMSIPNKDMIKELLKLEPNDIRISVDGPKEIHNQIRGDVFDKVENNIKLLRKLSPSQNIRINTTISKHNINHLHEMVDIAENWDVDLNVQHLIFLDDMHVKKQRIMSKKLLGSNLSHRADMTIFNKQEVETIIHQVDIVNKKAIENGVKATFLPEMKPSEISRYYLDTNNWVKNDKCNFIWAAVRIDHQGDIFPCFKYIYGNIRNQKLSDVWNNQKARNFRSRVRNVGLLPACIRCCKLN